MMGNPLEKIPKSLGACQALEVLDLSCCNLVSIPEEFTYMTRLLELNLATNELASLPNNIGRMSRLVILNVSDNKLTDLPLSLGMCIGLSKFGAGINLERNLIKDEEMIRKYKIGPDHMVDYLEKRMAVNGTPQLTEYEVPFLTKKEPKKVTQPLSESKPKTDIKEDNKKKLEEDKHQQELAQKLIVLKKWCNTTIQGELRPKCTNFAKNVSTQTDLQQVMLYAQAIKLLRPEIEKIKPLITQYDAPKPVFGATASKIEQLIAAITAAANEALLVLRSLQTALDTATTTSIVQLVTAIKGLKSAIDSNQLFS